MRRNVLHITFRVFITNCSRFLHNAGVITLLSEILFHFEVLLHNALLLHNAMLQTII